MAEKPDYGSYNYKLKITSSRLYGKYLCLKCGKYWTSIDASKRSSKCRFCKSNGKRRYSRQLRYSDIPDERRLYGRFKCSKCKKRWGSKNAWKEITQKCRKCKIPILPHYLNFLRIKDDSGPPAKPHGGHLTELCGKCHDLGFDCRLLGDEYQDYGEDSDLSEENSEQSEESDEYDEDLSETSDEEDNELYVSSYDSESVISNYSEEEESDDEQPTNKYCRTSCMKKNRYESDDNDEEEAENDLYDDEPHMYHYGNQKNELSDNDSDEYDHHDDYDEEEEEEVEDDWYDDEPYVYYKDQESELSDY